MTREEAIKLLECSATELVGTMMQTDEQTAVNQLQRYVDAFDVAIAALREQDAADTNVGHKSNADHIRSMTDEELAWELMLWRCEAVAKHHGVSSEYPDTQQTIFDWLKQPYQEDDHA